ncbi:MAG: efflux RND transporter permease subunit [Balneolales bacterium]|nr:efflux RND transporter permease subunit [Balneolales bacterium]
MKRIIQYFIKHPIMVNLGVGVIIILGFASFSEMRTTLLPKEDVNFITVDVVYRGASPEEVEEGITIKIEDNLQGIQDINRVTSISSENLAQIKIELTEDADANTVLQDVKNAVDKITTFPPDIDEPVVVKQDILNATVNFAITGDLPLQNLKDFAEEIENELLRQEGISQIFVQGYPEEEIEIQVDEETLRNYELTFQHVADAVRNANLDTSGGEIKTDSQRKLIRAEEKEYYARELMDIVVRARPDGQVLTLGDVATLVDRFADEPNRQYLNGEPAVVFQIFSLNDEDILANAEFVNRYIEDFNASHTGVEAVLIEDSTVNLRKRIETLSNNGITGAILVLLVLALFLDKRLAFWVALKIPIALLGMLIISVFYDLTLNQVSMFGAILVLGILVDDGVVIAENIYQHYKEKGKPPFKAAVDATLELMPAVFASLTTTAVAFCLFFFVHGIMGDFFSDVAFVVVATLVVAMIGTFLFLPSQIAHSKALRKDNRQSLIERKFNESLIWVRDHIYGPAVQWVLNKFSWGSVLLGAVLIMFSISMINWGWVSVTFFPNVEQDVLEAKLELTPGVNEARVEALLLDIEDAIYHVNEELTGQRRDGRDFVQKVERIIGPKSHEGRIRVTLLPGEDRELLSFEVADMWREKVGEVPEAENLSFGNPAFLFGAPISIALVGDDLESLRAAKEDLKAELYRRSDLKDVIDTDKQGISEINISLKPEGELLGLSLGMVMQQVRSAFFGFEAQSIQRGDEEIKLWVRYPEENRSSINDIQDMRIQTVTGHAYPLREIANLSFETGVLSINRQDGIREITVEADVANLSVPVPSVLADIEENTLPMILRNYPGVDYTMEGQSRESKKTQNSVRLVLPVFLILMLSLIIVNFKSFNQAFLVVLLLPFSIIGVIIGHIIHGVPLSIFSGIGLIALIGVLINNSLVFIDTYNENIKEGMVFFEAIVETAKSRFRAILLTTITTVAGLGPLIGTGSLGAQFLKPPAISIAYGLAFGTTLTLILLPSLLYINGRIRQLYFRLIKRINAPIEETEPAKLLLKNEVEL